ncbi:hypothetical protein ACHWQZ_G007939 [Mnemiopsis leidyi]
MKTIIPNLKQPSTMYKTRLSPSRTNPGHSPSVRIRPSSLPVGETRSFGDRLSPSRLKLKFRTPSPISARKPWDSSITTPEPRYVRSSTPSPIPSPISIPRVRPGGSTRFCSSCSPVGSSPGPVLYTYDSFTTQPRVRYRSLDDRPPWNSNTKTPPLFSVMSPLNDISHRRMSIRTAVRQVRSPIYHRKRFASAPVQTRLSPYKNFQFPVRVNQRADPALHRNQAVSPSPVPDREELIKLAEEEVLAIETQYEKSILSVPTVELSDISEITEQTNKHPTEPFIEEAHL